MMLDYFMVGFITIVVSFSMVKLFKVLNEDIKK